MSKFNHRSLAVCVAAALSLPAVAMAATAGYPAGTNSTYASNILQNASATLTSPAQYTITTQASDNIIGRTTGFGVRLILGNGVNFTAATTNAAAGAALTAGAGLDEVPLGRRQGGQIGLGLTQGRLILGGQVGLGRGGGGGHDSEGGGAEAEGAA